eukprot:TRINITY_DN45084_c0_g1_i1.p1 TRINITY_DN45084_c0_g1~~TRINITY_DN45084_c0_g1_i1.p1  ORF type:complete len:155 (-),score=27.75 TRINITY_DN45084_c0_g1_i1:116-580(-)
MVEVFVFFFFQAEDGIRDAQESRGLGDVYKRQPLSRRYSRAPDPMALRGLLPSEGLAVLLALLPLRGGPSLALGSNTGALGVNAEAVQASAEGNIPPNRTYSLADTEAGREWGGRGPEITLALEALGFTPPSSSCDAGAVAPRMAGRAMCMRGL